MKHVTTAEAQERYVSEALRVVKKGGWLLMQFKRAGLRADLLEWRGYVANAARGKRTFARAWRGTSVNEAALRALRRDDRNVDVLRIGSREIWLIVCER
jgi:hypothetical protein